MHTSKPNPAEPILFLLGLSGAGKTEMGRFASEAKGWLWLEIDRWPPTPDGIDLNGLRGPWNRYLEGDGNHGPLVSAIRERNAEQNPGIVLTFPSGLTRSAEDIAAVEPDITIRYLTGSATHCLAAFLRRENAEGGRGLPREWWIAHNLVLQSPDGRELLVSYLARPEIAKYCVPGFNADGTRRDKATVFAELVGTHG